MRIAATEAKSNSSSPKDEPVTLNGRDPEDLAGSAGGKRRLRALVTAVAQGRPNPDAGVQGWERPRRCLPELPSSLPSRST